MAEGSRGAIGPRMYRHFIRDAAGTVKSLLFLSAYAPLGIITSVLLWPRTWLLSVGIVIVSMVSVVLLLLYIWDVRNHSASFRLPMEQIQRRDGELVSYIVTYALPFLAIPFESVRISIGLALFFLLIWYMQVKLNLLHINPVLAFFGYHIYDVVTEGSVQILVSKKRRIATDTIHAVRAGNETVVFEVDRR